MRKACCSAVRGGNVKRAATLVENPGNRFSDAGSIPAISTKTHRYELFWFKNVFGLTRKLPQR